MRLPDPSAYGPNGQEVAALIERASRLTPSEAVQLAAAWPDARFSDAWDDAQAASWDAAEGSGRASTWQTVWDAAEDATRAAVKAGDWSGVEAEILGEATPSKDEIKEAAQAGACGATAHAALAVLVRDLITDEHYQTLTAPWRDGVNEG
ncbi:hypothetical protein ACWD0J_27170 [Streptomyces sp. NPDC003011]